MNTRPGPLLCALLAAAAAAALPARAMPPVAQPHGEDTAIEIRIEAATPRADRRRTLLAESPSFRAFTTQRPLAAGGSQSQLWIEELASGATYAVRDVPMPHRPFSDVRWRENHLLTFLRWSTPRHGMRYVIDARQRRLLRATPTTWRAPGQDP